MFRVLAYSMAFPMEGETKQDPVLGIHGGNWFCGIGIGVFKACFRYGPPVAVEQGFRALGVAQGWF